MKIQVSGKPTGFKHPKCYANADENCSTKISREHFISEVLLREVELRNTAKIAGLKWQTAGEFKIIPLNGLASNILCERHNSALAVFDTEIGKLSKTIRSFDRGLHHLIAASSAESIVINGDLIQGWMLKCLMGMASSGNLSVSNLKPECLDLLFGNRTWPRCWGLYLSPTSEQPLYHSDSFAIEVRFDPARKLILAAEFVVRGFPFVLCLGKPDNPASFGVLHPSEMVFRRDNFCKRLVFDWEKKAHGAAVDFNRIGVYDGPPPNWEEWQKK